MMDEELAQAWISAVAAESIGWRSCRTGGYKGDLWLDQTWSQRLEGCGIERGLVAASRGGG
ncbi:hypothetical protein KFK09_014814 [Dendrobium nobile]|uniref:Uncharacterized protein n=1 Tax=Dendrobium nobile TaxID=94219 RepID=A0A8T3B471_DENNO|nr:hypothetical protein KFK09_014814 [Dendrobium nobile]